MIVVSQLSQLCRGVAQVDAVPGELDIAAAFHLGIADLAK